MYIINVQVIIYEYAFCYHYTCSRPSYIILTTVKKRKLKWYMGMFHGHQDFPTQSCKAQYREGEGEVDREEDGKTTYLIGLG